VAAVGMGVWGTALPGLQQTILWALLILTAALLLRRGWLKLFGPVLFYDMVCLARRGRYFLLRMGYAAVLLFFLFINWAEMSHYGGDSQQVYARMAQQYFYQFMIIQLFAVMLLTPAYVGGSIAEEKERKTLEFMLATDLRNREIVLSKLAARLANLFMIVLIGLPILSFLQFMGGIDPNLMLIGFAATLVTAISLAGFSMLCSVYFKKPRDAIVCAYLGPFTYIVVGLLAEAARHNPSWGLAVSYLWQGGPSVSDMINIFNSGNVFTSLIQVGMAFDRRGSGSVATVLLSVWRDYTIFHLAVGLVCVVWSVLRLRAIALKQMGGAPQISKRRQRRRPAVSLRPVLWREVYVEGRARGSWMIRLFILVLVLLSVGSGVWVLYYVFVEYRGPGNYAARDLNGWSTGIGTMVACLVLLGVSVRASTCISSERDKQTFDFLLTTPLDSDTILWHKFLGCLLSLRWGLLWLGALWLIGLIGGGIFVLDVIAVIIALLIYAAAFILIGLWYSMTCRSGISATVWTLSTVVILSVGHWLPSACCFALAGFSNETRLLSDCQLGITPPFVLGFFHYAGFALRTFEWAASETGRHLVVSVIGLALYVLAIFLFWHVVLSPRFRQLTHRERRIRPRRRSG